MYILYIYIYRERELITYNNDIALYNITTHNNAPHSPRISPLSLPLTRSCQVSECRMAQSLPVPLGTRLVAAAAGWLRWGAQREVDTVSAGEW